MNVQVGSAGFLTSIQDQGRPGHRRSGISSGGALDGFALRVANGLVGNDDYAAGLELTLGKVRLRFEDERMVAWCGGAFSARIGNEKLPAGRCGFVGEDQELMIVPPEEGGRAWLAISGGLDVPLVLGSRSTDLRGGFGGCEGRALRDGDILPLKERRFEIADKRRFQTAAPWGAPATWAASDNRNPVLRIVRGTNWDRFAEGAHRSLLGDAFNVMSDSDRMGARLDGAPLERVDSGDLVSEAVTPGTLQVPPSGKPILLLGDCQTIGGYPKIAHVITVDLPMAAQLWAGDSVRFHQVSLAEAQKLLREREEDFARFRVGLSLHNSSTWSSFSIPIWAKARDTTKRFWIWSAPRTSPAAFMRAIRRPFSLRSRRPWPEASPLARIPALPIGKISAGRRSQFLRRKFIPWSRTRSERSTPWPGRPVAT